MVILVSILCEFASTIIYFMVIRKKFSEKNERRPFDWLPNRRKEQVVRYNRIVNEENTGLFWGNIVTILNRSSWIFLIIGFFMVLYLIATQ